MASDDRCTAFVAGATGYVGREVVRELCEAGHRTIAHVRPDSPKLAEWQAQFSLLGAEVCTAAWTLEAMSEALAGYSISHVFALLGTTKSRAKEEELEGDIYQAVDYGLTKILLEAALKTSPAPRFVYLSSVGAKADSRSSYLRVRGQVEEELAASGLSWMAAQPSIITGYDRDVDRPLERWGATVGDSLLRMGSLLGGAKVRARYQSTSATQLAAALVALGCSEVTGTQLGDALR
mgnify:CR=1 FL=1